VSYLEVNDMLMASNGEEIGFLIGDTFSPFALRTIPTTYLQTQNANPVVIMGQPGDTGQQIVDEDHALYQGELYGRRGNVLAPLHKYVMEPGEHMAFYNGRLYTLLGNILTFSDVYDIETRDDRKCRIPIPGYGYMIAAVEGGVWLSYSGKTVFLKGDEPDEFEFVEVADYAAVPWTVARFDGKDAAPDAPVGDSLIWMSEKGICMGGPDGQFTNISDGQDVEIPSPMTAGAGLVRLRDGLLQYIVSGST
jgi:hypothetical protein